MTNPSLWRPVRFDISARTGKSSGGAFGGERFHNTLVDEFHIRFASRGGIMAYYFAGLLLGQKYYYEYGGITTEKEIFFPFNNINEEAFVSGAGMWDPNPLGFSPAWYKDIPTLLRLKNDGTDPERLSWHTTYTRSDILIGASGWDYGISYLLRALWDPKLRYDAWIPSYAGSDPLGYSINNPAVGIYRPDSDDWTIEQWPYGGPTPRTPLKEAGGTKGSAQYYSCGTRPCWILSSQPYKIDLQSQPELLSFANGQNNMGIKREVLFWFMPETDESFQHYPVWITQNWLTKIYPDQVNPSHFFHGVPIMHWPPGLVLHQWFYGTGSGSEDTAYFNNCVGYFYNNVPAAVNPAYPNSSTQPALPQRIPFPGYNGQPFETQPAGNIHIPPSGGNHSPHLGLNPQFKLPYLEFNRPDWIDFLPPGTTVESATANVRVSGVKRVEFKLTWWMKQPSQTDPIHTPVNTTPGIFQPAATFLCTPGPYGFLLEQKSMKTAGSNPGDDNEEYRTIMKVTDQIQSNGSAIPDIDNTHIHHLEYEKWIEGTYGVTLAITNIPGETAARQPPLYIPKSTPWFSTNSPYAPKDIVQLKGAKMGHVLMGLQSWGEFVGREADDLGCPRSLKEFERNLLWHPNGHTFEGFEPGTDPDIYNRFLDMIYERRPSNVGEDYLRWLRDANPGDVPDLKNYRYRFLEKCKALPDEAGGNDNIIPDDGSFHQINFVEIIQAMIDDKEEDVSSPYTGTSKSITKKHSIFRIYPSLPNWGPFPIEGSPGYYNTRNEDSFGLWKGNGDSYFLNASPFFGFHMPTKIDMVYDGSPMDSFRTVWEDITFQSFASWEIKSIKALLRLPSGEALPVSISTQWD